MSALRKILLILIGATCVETVIKEMKKLLKRLGQCNQFLAARKRQILRRTN